ncbi:MAG TPA: hypothetical protein PLQ54_17810, partial [Armatimonadota bacterium]|nr:hypothetical protein [Armatimonadota bacterium]
MLVLWCVAALVRADAGAVDLARGDGARIAAESAQAAVQRPAAALIDGDPATTFRWEWANGGAEAVIDLGRPALELLGQDAGVDFLKTSTGMHKAGGATAEHVRLMAQTAPRCKIKAAGGKVWSSYFGDLDA